MTDNELQIEALQTQCKEAERLIATQRKIIANKTNPNTTDVNWLYFGTMGLLLLILFAC